MVKILPPTIEGWDEKRYWVFIRSLLRKGWNKYPVKYQAMKNARRLIPKNRQKKGSRQRYEYQCKFCEKWFPMTQVNTDHIYPCGELACFEHLPKFVRNLLCEIKETQILCKDCHGIKTYMERYHVSWKVAAWKKELAQFSKLPAEKQNEFLSAQGFDVQHLKNKKAREAAYWNFLKEREE